MARYAGTNAVVEITDSGGAKTVGVLRSYQLPALQRARVDVTGVADSFAFTLPGRFQQTEFRYTEVWDPLDTTGPTIDALILSGEQVTIKVTTTDGTAPVNTSFTGRVADAIPSEASGEAGLFRDVVIVTNSAMSHAAPGP